jgi:hypothetical protein
MHEDHFGGDVRQIEGFLDCGVSPADHRDLLVTIKKAVAGGAGRDPAAAEGLLGRQAEIHGAGARGDDERIAAVDGRVAGQLEGARREIDRVDVIEDDLGLEALGVAPHPLHQVRSLNAVGVARPVVHVGRRHQLASLFQSSDEDRAQVGACGVDGRGVAGGAGSQDQEPAVFGFTHISILQQVPRCVWCERPAGSGRDPRSMISMCRARRCARERRDAAMAKPGVHGYFVTSALAATRRTKGPSVRPCTSTEKTTMI